MAWYDVDFSVGDYPSECQKSGLLIVGRFLNLLLLMRSFIELVYRIVKPIGMETKRGRNDTKSGGEYKME